MRHRRILTAATGARGSTWSGMRRQPSTISSCGTVAAASTGLSPVIAWSFEELLWRAPDGERVDRSSIELGVTRRPLTWTSFADKELLVKGAEKPGTASAHQTSWKQGISANPAMEN